MIDCWNSLSDGLPKSSDSSSSTFELNFNSRDARLLMEAISNILVAPSRSDHAECGGLYEYCICNVKVCRVCKCIGAGSIASQCSRRVFINPWKPSGGVIVSSSSEVRQACTNTTARSAGIESICSTPAESCISHRMCRIDGWTHHEVGQFEVVTG